MKKYILLMIILLGFSSGELKAQGDGTPFLGQILFVSFNFAPKGWQTAMGKYYQLPKIKRCFLCWGQLTVETDRQLLPCLISKAGFFLVMAAPIHWDKTLVKKIIL
jgi:hypothetical protein